MKYTKKDILGVTLLSLEEYKENKDIIPNTDNWWWLRSPGIYNAYAAYIFMDGEIYADGYKVSSPRAGVRPLIYLNPEKAKLLKPGDKVNICKFPATVMEDRSVLLDEGICCRRYDPSSNDWDKSELKSFLESKEFLKIVSGRRKCG